MSIDLYQEVTNKIISQLEAGTIPWVKPWVTQTTEMPHNAISKKPYRGINSIILSAPAGAAGNAWLTFKQAKGLGAHVRKGEKGQIIVFFKPWIIKDANSEEGTEKTIPLLRSFTVFHTSQIDNLPEQYLPKAPISIPEVERIAAADVILSKAVIRHGGNKAFYAPSRDIIQLPEPGTFRTIGDYYATAFHELTHWTGHAKRCNRDFSGRFGDTAYAREELVAEMGAAFLLNKVQIQGEMQHASYIASWLKVLKSDKRAVIMAASAAQKAADFILGQMDDDVAELQAEAA